MEAILQLSWVWSFNNNTYANNNILWHILDSIVIIKTLILMSCVDTVHLDYERYYLNYEIQFSSHLDFLKINKYSIILLILDRNILETPCFDELHIGTLYIGSICILLLTAIILAAIFDFWKTITRAPVYSHWTQNHRTPIFWWVTQCHHYSVYWVNVHLSTYSSHIGSHLWFLKPMHSASFHSHLVSVSQKHHILVSYTSLCCSLSAYADFYTQ